MKSNIAVTTKNIVIGFFVVVFIMGFFSKSIVNLFLPKVIVESAIDGFVERTLNIEGVIEAEKSFKVRLGGAVIVDECFVKVGDIVESGKPLFRIDKSYGIKDSGSGLEGLRLQLEAKRIRLGNLKQETYEIDEKNIAAMEHRLVKSKEELMKQQELFTAGVISKQEMESFEADIEEQMFAIEVSGLQLKEKKRNDEANIEELENEIERDGHQILELQKQNEFYGNVDNEGIYYSAANGIVTYLSELQRIIPGDTVLTEIADVSSDDALIYTANINEEDYDFVKSAGEIEIIGKSILDSMYLKISSVGKMNNTDLFQVDASWEAKY
jgi:multidrug efflux pump subunit AcrA (membrane-fusion protein)